MLRLRQIERDIGQIDATIETAIMTDKTLCEKAAILVSIPPLMIFIANYCQSVNARIGQLKRKTGGESGRACTNLAPMGKWQGKERIRGGRARLRRAIYLAAVVATRFNLDMKAKYHELIAKGKRKNLRLQPLCASLWLWQMRCYATVENGLK